MIDWRRLINIQVRICHQFLLPPLVFFKFFSRCVAVVFCHDFILFPFFFHKYTFPFLHSNIIIFLSTCIFFFYFSHQTFSFSLRFSLFFFFFTVFPFEAFFLHFFPPFAYILFSCSLSPFKLSFHFFYLFLQYEMHSRFVRLPKYSNWAHNWTLFLKGIVVMTD